ncbi:MAG: trypsin-like peptidase domain-containing protein [Terriglobales bacterium]
MDELHAPLPPASPAAGPAGLRWWVLVVVRVVGLCGGWALARWRNPSHGSAPALTQSLAAAESRVAPAVVTIAVQSSRPVRGRFRQPANRKAPDFPRLDHSQGSGVIVDARGYVLTNRHVVRRAVRIQVSVAGDSRPYFARLVGEDPDTDLALLKIDATHPLPTVRFGDSARLAVGDWVVAIGSPFGLDGTVTAGIISSLHRSVDPSKQFESFIQTDAPINPGNSGGPLVDLRGEVIGINTAIYTESDGYQGIGFALPSDLVAHVIPALLQHGKVTRGSIGVYFESQLDPAVRRVYGLPSGVPLTQVAAKGPAASAGLKAGDVITSLDQQPVADGSTLMQRIEFLPVGTSLRVGYERDGQSRTATVRVADRDQLYPPPAGDRIGAVAASARTQPNLGMVLEDSTKAPVEVIGVTPDSFADQIGVEAGDEILQCNRQPVGSRRAFTALIRSLRPGADVAILVARHDDQGGVSRWLLGGTLPPPLAVNLP